MPTGFPAACFESGSLISSTGPAGGQTSPSGAQIGRFGRRPIRARRLPLPRPAGNVPRMRRSWGLPDGGQPIRRSPAGELEIRQVVIARVRAELGHPAPVPGERFGLRGRAPPDPAFEVYLQAEAYRLGDEDRADSRTPRWCRHTLEIPEAPIPETSLRPRIRKDSGMAGSDRCHTP
jgi:hypothetical protein